MGVTEQEKKETPFAKFVHPKKIHLNKSFCLRIFVIWANKQGVLEGECLLVSH